MRKVAAPIGLDLPGKCAATAGPEGSENALTRRLRDLTGLQKTHGHHRGGLTNPNCPLARNQTSGDLKLSSGVSALPLPGKRTFTPPPLLYHHRTTGSKTHPDSWIPLYHHAQSSPFKLRAIIARRAGRSVYGRTGRWLRFVAALGPTHQQAPVLLCNP